MDYLFILPLAIIISGAILSYILKRRAFKPMMPEHQRILKHQLYKTSTTNLIGLGILIVTALAIILLAPGLNRYGIVVFWSGFCVYLVVTRIIAFRKLDTLGFSREFTYRYKIAESITTAIMIIFAMSVAILILLPRVRS